MYFLNELCDTSAVLRLFYVIKLVFYALQIILPLICIFMTMKRCFKAMISDDSQKKLKELAPQTMKMLAAAFIFFFVPYIVEYAVNGLGENDVDFAYCFLEAELDNIKDLQEREMLAIEEGREDTQEELDEVSKKRQEEALKKYNQKAEQDRTNASNTSSSSTTSNSQSTGGSSTQSTTQTSTNSSNILKSGKEGKYFAPIQNINYSIGVKNLTGGCNNEVYHDAPVATGTPIYAGMDGTVTYYQYVCGSTLYGYGNLAILMASDGTYIRYAHLSRFAGGFKTIYTNTCPKKGNTQPCPSNECDVNITTVKIGSRQVVKGEIIGYSGDTGNSTGPHLHVEIHENGSNTCVTDPFKAFGMR